ncbi:gamma-butyrobetaine hydroxylase-like domain-containing protein [Kaarinaea lacus]
MADTAEPQPTEIKLHQKSRNLEISFSDGKSFELPCEYLRVFSTSAEVQAAKERGEVIIGKENVNITAIEPVGSYAINIVFDDGHDTGIFSWSTLYTLGQDYEKNWQQYLKGRKQAGFGVYSVPENETATASKNVSENKKITILYFVSLVKKLGKETEDCDLPAEVETVADLLAWLRKRGGVWETLLQENKVTVTANKVFTKADTPIENGAEVAIVPKTPY